ncbi:MAG: TonB family protein [Methylococcales bacterium]|nr:TonB family protein [Methylococcales bacterium]
MMLRAKFRSDSTHLFIALVVAIFFHIVMILGVNISIDEGQNINEPILISMISNSNTAAPDQLSNPVSQNQLNALSEQKKIATPLKMVKQKVAQKLKSDKKIDNKGLQHTKQKKPPLKTVNKVESKADNPKSAEDVPHLTADSLQQQIKQLGSEIRASQLTSEQPKIKFVDSIESNKYLAAQYVKDWENKVERTGNLNFPSVAAKKNFSGSLILDVGIKSDGSIYSIRINKSSGIDELDEAAKNIVRMSAPFPPLPLEITKELDVFVITRVWTFTDESGLDTH